MFWNQTLLERVLSAHRTAEKSLLCCIDGTFWKSLEVSGNPTSKEPGKTVHRVVSYLRHSTTKLTTEVAWGSCKPLGAAGHRALQLPRTGEAKDETGAELWGGHTCCRNWTLGSRVKCRESACAVGTRCWRCTLQKPGEWARWSQEAKLFLLQCLTSSLYWLRVGTSWQRKKYLKHPDPFAQSSLKGLLLRDNKSRTGTSIYLGVELPGHRVAANLALVDYASFQRFVPIYDFIGNVQKFQFFHMLANTLYCQSFFF